MEPIDHVESVAVGLWIGAGAAEEEARYAGISHFTEHMMFKGTARRSALEIAYDIDKIGGQINAFTGKEATCYYVKATRGHFADAADVLTDMLTGSLFAKQEMDRERNVITEEIKMTMDTPDDLVVDTLSDLIFRERSIGNSVLGTTTSLNRITGKVMREYVFEKYTADRLVISVSGRFDEQEVVDFFSDRFDGLKPVQERLERKDAEYVPSVRSIRKDIEQAHLCLGTDTISMADDRYYALTILNNAIGGSMSSRLFQNIREQKGLAYSVYSMNVMYSRDGYFAIYAGVSHDNVRKAIAGIREELDKLADKGITEEELESSREQMKASYIFSQESISSRMFKNGKNLLLLDRVYDQEELIRGFEEVTLKDVDAVIPLIADFSRYSAACVSSTRADLRQIMKG